MIYNRLKANNPLGIDATIRYEDQNYDGELTKPSPRSPYDTRTHRGSRRPRSGIPVSPRSRRPRTRQGQLPYYVVKPGTCNETNFTASAAEFQRAVAEYQQALAGQGRRARPSAELM